MMRPTCTGPSLTTLDAVGCRVGCDGLTAPAPAHRLARTIARANTFAALHNALVAVEYAAIHCRISADERASLSALHGRRYSHLRRRELQRSGLYRSVTLVLRDAPQKRQDPHEAGLLELAGGTDG